MDEDLDEKAPVQFVPALQDLVHQLVIGNYTGLDADGRAGRLTAEMIERAVREYGRTLIDMPREAIEDANAFALDNEDGAWAIDIDLWTAEEEDELTLQAIARTTPDGIRVEITNLHVL